MEEEDKEASAGWEDDEEDGITGTVLSPNLLVSAHPTEHCICIYAPEAARFRAVSYTHLSVRNPS